MKRPLTNDTNETYIMKVYERPLNIMFIIWSIVYVDWIIDKDWLTLNNIGYVDYPLKCCHILCPLNIWLKHYDETLKKRPLTNETNETSIMKMDETLIKNYWNIMIETLWWNINETLMKN